MAHRPHGLRQRLRECEYMFGGVGRGIKEIAWSMRDHLVTINSRPAPVICVLLRPVNLIDMLQGYDRHPSQFYSLIF